MKHLVGFTDYQIDAVVKFGGSLLSDHKTALIAANSIQLCAARGRRLLIIPGGGPTDKTIESLNARHPFHHDTHHRACARAQDQTGLMLCDPALSSGLHPCETLEEVRQVIARGKTPVLLPSRLIFDIDPFARVWEITSDAMACWFAWLVGAPRVVILTNVNGVYPPDTESYTGIPIDTIKASTLATWGHTSVDVCTAPFLLRHKIDGWVMHGGVEEGRLEAVLTGQPATATHIIPE